ncbi:UNVERIFIED_CONTAM: hypothetical protein K2H54_059267 [Gekko kuhli]
MLELEAGQAAMQGFSQDGYGSMSEPGQVPWMADAEIYGSESDSSGIQQFETRMGAVEEPRASVGVPRSSPAARWSLEGSVDPTMHWKTKRQMSEVSSSEQGFHAVMLEFVKLERQSMEITCARDKETTYQKWDKKDFPVSRLMRM